MPATLPSVKRHNHRVHPCDPQHKTELLLHLLQQYSGLRTLVVTSEDAAALRSLITGENVTVSEDAALPDTAAGKYDLLISYDLPADAADYLARLPYTKTYALLLLEPEAQQRLYPVEMLLGRTMMQETVKGFGPETACIEPKRPGSAPSGRRDEARSDRKNVQSKPRHTAEPKPRRPYDKTAVPQTDGARPADKWTKTKRPLSRYLGKDENGKPRFSGKTRERNHAFDGAPKTADGKVPAERSAGKPDGSGGPAKKYDKKPRTDTPSGTAAAKGTKPYRAPKGKGKPYGTDAGKAYPSKGPVKKNVSKRPPRKIPLSSLRPPKEQE